MDVDTLSVVVPPAQIVAGDAVGCEVMPIIVCVPPGLVHEEHSANDAPPVKVIFPQFTGATLMVLPPGAVAATSIVIKKYKGVAFTKLLKAGNVCNPGPPAGFTAPRGMGEPLKLFTVFRHNLN